MNRSGVGVESGVPIYEYEPVDHDCLMCEGRVAAIQGVDEQALEFCPDCGLPVRRVVTSASFKISGGKSDRSGQRGFTTWKKVEEGKWEKVSGPGVDMIVGDPRDVQAVKEESKPKKIVDLE